MGMMKSGPEKRDSNNPYNLYLFSQDKSIFESKYTGKLQTTGEN